MLAAVEFDNQVLADAAEIGEVRTDPVLSAKFKSSQALGLEVLPQLPFLIRRFGTKPSAATTRSFILGIHKSRASEGAEKGPPLGRRSGTRLPLSGGEY
jgi:hypothetical protein